MPTQEELNAAQVELDIANNNYAQLANKYNKYQNIFKLYTNASPEVQAKAKDVMVKALDEFNNLKLNMYAAEDRIQQAQNKWNNYQAIVNQPVQTVQPTAGVKRRVINQGLPTVEEVAVANEQPTNTNNNIFLQNWTIPMYDNQWNIVGQQKIPYANIGTNWLKKGVVTGTNTNTTTWWAYTWAQDPYKWNNLRWITWNLWAGLKGNFQEAGETWKNEIWPGIKKTGRNIGNWFTAAPEKA